jgi:hypothetical protein
MRCDIVILLLQDGKELTRMSGYMAAPQMQELIQKALASAA